MKARGMVPEKQQLLSILEKAYTKAHSIHNFYKLIETQDIALYSYRGKIKGIKTTRKYRFSSLGYTTEFLQLLDKKITKNVRLDALKKIREHGQERKQEHSKGRERTRER